MNHLELEFRKELTKEMSGFWSPTIHVESHLNPGVPDLSYVMIAPGCETGWLELKALPNSAMVSVKVERSQHQWMTVHAHRIPAHFLILVGDECFLVHGRNHKLLLGTISVMDDLLPASIAVFDRKRIRQMLPPMLIASTKRGRNDQI